MIEAIDLVKRYGGFAAVRGVSFVVEPGRVVGLLGPNGAGKTSIMRAITAYHAPSSGTVRVAGVDVVDDPVGAKSLVGYLPENAPMYPDPTPEEYLRFVAAARGLARPKEAVERAAEACGLQSVWRVAAGRLSKGFRQRLGLAQAIVHDPEILVLDEPTSGLDPNQILEIRALIAELGKRKTVLLSTHILQEAEALCGSVLILADGLVVARGSAEEIAGGLRGGERLRLLVRGASAERIAALAAGFPGAGVASVAPGEGGSVVLELSTTPEGGAAAAEAAFDWAVTSGLKILELRRERLSLEEIFVALTKEEPGR